MVRCSYFIFLDLLYGPSWEDYLRTSYQFTSNDKCTRTTLIDKLSSQSYQEQAHPSRPYGPNPPETLRSTFTMDHPRISGTLMIFQTLRFLPRLCSSISEEKIRKIVEIDLIIVLILVIFLHNLHWSKSASTKYVPQQVLLGSTVLRISNPLTYVFQDSFQVLLHWISKLLFHR